MKKIFVLLVAMVGALVLSACWLHLHDWHFWILPGMTFFAVLGLHSK